MSNAGGRGGPQKVLRVLPFVQKKEKVQGGWPKSQPLPSLSSETQLQPGASAACAWPALIIDGL